MFVYELSGSRFESSCSHLCQKVCWRENILLYKQNMIRDENVRKNISFGKMREILNSRETSIKQIGYLMTYFIDSR